MQQQPPLTIAQIAMIVFFGLFGLFAFFVNPTHAEIVLEGIAALVAAVALFFRK